MSRRNWLLSFLIIVLVLLVGICSITASIDPFMHYHKPLTDDYYYTLDNERSQNDGIIRHFDYNGIITGTSMTENFRTSEADRIFDAQFIKVPFAGATFKEINDNLEKAFEVQPGIKYVIRSLDRYEFLADKDAMRDDMGEYPVYLYDNNPFNDVKYLLNRNVLYTRVWSMIAGRRSGIKPGITSFDDYVSTGDNVSYGKTVVLQDLYPYGNYDFSFSDEVQHLTEKEKETIRENVRQNVTDLADANPSTVFYYFLPPYSAAFWAFERMYGNFEHEIEMEEYAIEQIVSHENIHLFGWNRHDLLDDMNNYRDKTHYAEWINSWMLVQMKNESGRLTEDNYEEFIEDEYEHYSSFDYSSIVNQEYYEADYYAAGLLNHEITGVSPWHLDQKTMAAAEIKGAGTSIDEEGNAVIDCRGILQRNEGEGQMAQALYAGDYIGAKITLKADDYRAVVFEGKKVSSQGQPSVYVYDSAGNVLKSMSLSYADIDGNPHQYALNLAGIYGDVAIIFNGGYTDNTGASDSEYIFTDITIY